MARLSLPPTTTRILGQILTYYYNGIMDAKIAEEFVSYFQTSGRAYATEGTVTQQRAQKLIEAAGEHLSPDYLIGLAFTIYRTNGYGNYICAKRLQVALRTPYKDELDEFVLKYVQKLETELEVFHDYHQERDGWMPFMGFWFENSMRTFKQAQDFAAKRFGYDDRLFKPEIARACLIVQKQNSANNLEVAQALVKKNASHDPKVILLRQAAQELAESQLFLKSCSLTEKIAAHSDKTLIGLLRIRFPRMWLRWPKLRR